MRYSESTVQFAARSRIYDRAREREMILDIGGHEIVHDCGTLCALQVLSPPPERDDTDTDASLTRTRWKLMTTWQGVNVKPFSQFQSFDLVLQSDRAESGGSAAATSKPQCNAGQRRRRERGGFPARARSRHSSLQS